MKYKLPEGFKLIKTSDDKDSFVIYDQEKKLHSLKKTHLGSTILNIHHYVEQTRKLKLLVLPEKMRIEDKGIDMGFSLFEDTRYIANSSNIDELVWKAHNKTALDFNISMLNNGEEIEL